MERDTTYGTSLQQVLKRQSFPRNTQEEGSWAYLKVGCSKGPPTLPSTAQPDHRSLKSMTWRVLGGDCRDIGCPAGKHTVHRASESKLQSRGVSWGFPNICYKGDWGAWCIWSANLFPYCKITIAGYRGKLMRKGKGTVAASWHADGTNMV